MTDADPGSRDLFASEIGEQVLSCLQKGRDRGFVGPGSLKAHAEHALAFATVGSEKQSRVLDLGSGGGLPGLVLAALVWTSAEWVLLDSSTKRVEFLLDVVTELGLSDRIAIEGRRAEEAARDVTLRATFDTVVSRSFGKPAVAAECAAPFLVKGGRLLVSEPPHASAEQRWPAEGLRQLGLVLDQITAGPPSLAVMRQRELCPSKFPRRIGIPGKRPLF